MSTMRKAIGVLLLVGIAMGTTMLASGADLRGPYLTESSVDTGKIQTDAVTTTKLLNLSVSTGKISPAAVDTEKLSPAAVTTPKLADSAVDTDKLGSGAVTTPKLGASAVAPANVQQGSTYTVGGLNTGGKIGAGTTSPSEQLHVVGSIKAIAGGVRVDTGTLAGSPAFFIHPSDGKAGFGTASPLHKIHVSGGGLWVSTSTLESDPALFVKPTNGNVGIWNTNPIYPLDLTANNIADFAAAIRNLNTTSSDGLLIQGGVTSSNQTAAFRSASGATLMSLLGNGALGIGTSTPVQRLSVLGGGVRVDTATLVGLPAFFVDPDGDGIAIGDNDVVSGVALKIKKSSPTISLERSSPGGSPVSISVQAPVLGGGNGRFVFGPHNFVEFEHGTAIFPLPVLMVDGANGRVGIATGTPGQTLDVQGTAAFGTTGKSTFTADGQALIPLRVGIGTAAPTSPLGVVGNGVFTGTVTAAGFNAVGTAYQVNGVDVIRADGNLAGTVIASSVAAAAVGSVQLADSAVDTAKIGSGAVTAVKIFDGAVQTSKLQSGAVGSSAILDAAVQTAKIGSDAVTAVKIADGAVQTAKLGEAAVTNAKLASSGLSASKFTTGTLPTGQLPANSGTASLDFGIVGGLACADLTITVTGAVDGQPCEPGVPNALGSTTGLKFTCFVSASNTATVRACCNNGETAGVANACADPAAATVRALVWSY